MLGKKCGFAFPGFPGLGKPHVLGCHSPVCPSWLWDGQAGLSAHPKQELPEGSLTMPVAVLSGPWTPALGPMAGASFGEGPEAPSAEVFALSLWHRQATKQLLHLGVAFPTVK